MLDATAELKPSAQRRLLSKPRALDQVYLYM